MQGIFETLRSELRELLADPDFIAIAVLSLALGVGAADFGGAVVCQWFNGSVIQ